MNADDDFPHTDTALLRQDPSMPDLPLLPDPETVFLQWLMSLPVGSNVGASARRQIELIDRRATSHPQAARLRALFAAALAEPVRSASIN
jgi:hypothetical protein